MTFILTSSHNFENGLFGLAIGLWTGTVEVKSKSDERPKTGLSMSQITPAGSLQSVNRRDWSAAIMARPLMRHSFHNGPIMTISLATSWLTQHANRRPRPEEISSRGRPFYIRLSLFINAIRVLRWIQREAFGPVDIATAWKPRQFNVKHLLFALQIVFNNISWFTIIQPTKIN